jgi:riboflavin kinase / FMN adenylyltransferase
MRVFEGDTITGISYPIVTLGIFDGVHRGHVMLLDSLKERAKELGGESVVVTFSPHPRLVVGNSPEPLLFLTAPDEKVTLLRRAGIDNLVILNFTEELSLMTACEFIEKVLFGKLGMRHLMVGFNHRFGASGSGDFADIQRCADRLGFGIEQVGSMESASGAISSTAIRRLISAGNIEAANNLLGYSYFIEGTIVGGKKIGREIGYPTANVSTSYVNKLLPGDGVYVVKVKFNGSEFGGMANIGHRPTVNTTGEPRTVEVHIFDFNASIYGQEVSLSFLHRLRNEMKFASVEELKLQLDRDRESAKAHLSGG